MGAALALRGVTKRYRRRGPWVLAGADLVLEPGSLTSIVGSNGSGKSTLLRVAAGVSAPSGGTADVPSRVGFVPERQAGRGRLSGSAYVAHMGRIRGLDQGAAAGTDLLERLGLRPGPEVPWDQLSKGNRQKVVVAQAFLGRLDAIVLDEPFSGLDDGARSALVDLIAEARERGTLVLVSSHDVPPGVGETYRIVQGRLEPQAAAAPSPGASGLRRLELVRRSPTASPHTLTARPDVVTWRAGADDNVLVLDIDATGSDACIRAALDSGWSVRSVTPGDTAGKV